MMNLLYTLTGYIILAWYICFSSCDADPEPIRGGNVDIENEAIWLVSIQIFTLGAWKHVCGGSLINERDIITAAHCFVMFARYSRKGYIPNIYRDLKKGKFRVVIGLKDLTLKDFVPGRGIEKKIKRVFIHKDYETRSGFFVNDIAVIRLKKPLDDEDRKIDPKNKFGYISLFHPNETLNKDNCFGRGLFGAGFGVINIKENGDYERDGLRKILNVHFTEKLGCPFPGLKLVHYIHQTSAIQGFCRGDSGGSIYFKNGNNDFALVGVISTGPSNSDLRLCSGATSKITFLPEYLDFIESIKNVDESRIRKQNSLEGYDQTGAMFFVLPDHNNIAKLKYFNNTPIYTEF